MFYTIIDLTSATIKKAYPLNADTLLLPNRHLIFETGQ